MMMTNNHVPVILVDPLESTAKLSQSCDVSPPAMTTPLALLPSCPPAPACPEQRRLPSSDDHPAGPDTWMSSNHEDWLRYGSDDDSDEFSSSDSGDSTFVDVKQEDPEDGCARDGVWFSEPLGVHVPAAMLEQPDYQQLSDDSDSLYGDSDYSDSYSELSAAACEHDAADRHGLQLSGTGGLHQSAGSNPPLVPVVIAPRAVRQLPGTYRLPTTTAKLAAKKTSPQRVTKPKAKKEEKPIAPRQTRNGRQVVMPTKYVTKTVEKAAPKSAPKKKATGTGGVKRKASSDTRKGDKKAAVRKPNGSSAAVAKSGGSVDHSHNDKLCPFCIPSDSPGSCDSDETAETKRSEKAGKAGGSGTTGAGNSISKRRRRMQKLGRWWRKYGYDGPPYCQRCADTFSNHVMRKLTSTGVCSHTKLCKCCDKIASYLPPGSLAKILKS